MFQNSITKYFIWFSGSLHHQIHLPSEHLTADDQSQIKILAYIHQVITKMYENDNGY